MSPSAIATMTTLNVTWGRVECLLRNGDIRGYNLTIESRYGTENRQTLGTENENRIAVFTNLIPNTLYDIRIAAVTVDNTIGTEVIFNATTLPVNGTAKISAKITVSCT